MSLVSFKKHIEAKEAKREGKPKKYNKYRANKSVDEAGRSFDSGLERAIFNLLELRQSVGEIIHIQQQDSIYLSEANILYKPDFKCTLLNGQFLWVEAKGFKTPVWGIKKRLWKVYGPGPLEIWEGSAKYPKLSETIIPLGEKGESNMPKTIAKKKRAVKKKTVKRAARSAVKKTAKK